MQISISRSDSDDVGPLRFSGSVLARAGLIVFALSCNGCALTDLVSSTGPTGAAPELYQSFAARRKEYYTGKVAAASGAVNAESALGVSDKTSRNNVINDFILMIDADYFAYESSLVSGKSGSDFAVKVATLGLTAPAGFVSGGTAKILAAIAGGIVGTQTAFNESFLRSQAMDALIQKMQAARKTKVGDIRTRMKSQLADYPFSEAIADLTDYYSSGTLQGAFRAVSETASEQKKDATEERDATRTKK